MAESSVAARNDNMSKAVEAEIRFANGGQAAAIVIALIGLVAGISFFAMGNNLAGGALVSFPLVMLVKAVMPSRGSDSPPE